MWIHCFHAGAQPCKVHHDINVRPGKRKSFARPCRTAHKSRCRPWQPREPLGKAGNRQLFQQGGQGKPTEKEACAFYIYTQRPETLCNYRSFPAVPHVHFHEENCLLSERVVDSLCNQALTEGWHAGGGPAGLLVALGLLKATPHLRVKVYERAQRYRECGAGISLHVNGLKSIKAISPEIYKQFEERVFEFATFDECDQAGKLP